VSGDGDDGESHDDTDRADAADGADEADKLGMPADAYDEFDLPADVEATLGQLLTEAAAAARRREADEASALVETVETVTKNKVPADSVRERLLHGCTAVDRLVADEPLVAAEYLSAMARLVESSSR
jgi:hypothetical protein